MLSQQLLMLKNSYRFVLNFFTSEQKTKAKTTAKLNKART